MPAQTPKSLKATGFAVTKLAPYRCVSPKCRKLGKDNPEFDKRIHYIHSPLEKCSTCGERNFWYALAIVHMIQPINRGIIVAKEYNSQSKTILETGERMDFLCEKSYKGYREVARSPNQPKSYTENPNLVTCYDCLKAYNNSQHPLGNIIVEGF